MHLYVNTASRFLYIVSRVSHSISRAISAFTRSKQSGKLRSSTERSMSFNSKGQERESTRWEATKAKDPDNSPPKKKKKELRCSMEGSMAFCDTKGRLLT